MVVATGDNAEIGRISQMVSQVEQTKTNLLIQMEVLARWLAVIVVVISLGTFLLAWFRGGHSPGSAFQTAVAVAVAMIPAGLPALTTIVLAVSFGINDAIGRAAAAPNMQSALVQANR